MSKFHLNVKNTTFIFSNKNHGLQKKLLIEKAVFSVDKVKIIEYMLYTPRVYFRPFPLPNKGSRNSILN